jgi:hypothetical protein
MVDKRKAGLFAAALFTAAALARPVMAVDNGQPLSGRDTDTMRVLELVDQAKAGKVSRQEYMTAMEVQYSRLAGTQHGVMDVGDTTTKGRTSSSPHR